MNHYERCPRCAMFNMLFFAQLASCVGAIPVDPLLVFALSTRIHYILILAS